MSKRVSGSTKPKKFRDVRRALVQQSARKKVKSHSVKHVPKARLEEVTAELDSQVAHVQSLYTTQTQVKSEGTPVSNPNLSVEGLGDILRGL